MPIFGANGIPVVILSSVGDIFFDLVDDCTVTEDVLVTKNPTESGVNITDHIVNLPISIRISGRFVDSPMSVGGASVFNPAAALTSALASKLGANRSVAQWHELEKLKARKELVPVVVQQATGKAYQNMAISKLVGPRSVGDGGSQRFMVELTEIITTKSSLTAVEQLASDIQYTAGAEVDYGVGAGVPVP